MNSRVAKFRNNHSAPLANGRGSAQRGGSELQKMADQRPEAALQRQVQAWGDGSERVGQLRAWQGVVDGRGVGGKRQDLTPGFALFGGAIQRQEAEEDALQGKFGTVQRQEEEEPLQGKSEALQRVEQEEPLQGRFDAVQRVEDEEPLQGKFVTAQRVEEEEPLQGKFDAVQRVEEEEPLQGKFEAASSVPEEAAKPNDTGLPDNLKNGIESLSGMSMDSVKVHYNSSKPAQLNALAYAQGTDIHVAPGQERHLPHEAWHVVQQTQGRVRPTMQMKAGVAVNDDRSLEDEADVMGARALSVSQTVHRGSLPERGSDATAGTRTSGIVQKKEVDKLDDALNSLSTYSMNNKPGDGTSVAAYVNAFETGWVQLLGDTLKPETKQQLLGSVKIRKSVDALTDCFDKSDQRPPKDSDAANPKRYVFITYLIDTLFDKTTFLTREALAALDQITMVKGTEAEWSFGVEEGGYLVSAPLDALSKYRTTLRTHNKIVTEEGIAAIKGYVQGMLGDRITGAMRTANVRNPKSTDDPFNYPRVPYKDQGVLNAGQGYLDPTYWNPIEFSSFILKRGVKPSVAVTAAFSGPTRLECLSSTRAVLAKGLLDTLGAPDFDQFFSYVSDNDPGVVIGTNTKPRDRVRELMETPQASDPSHLMKGDWIYYQNDVRYLQKHPAGLWQGENCIYEGGLKFSGLGLSGMTLQGLKTSMEEHFNEAPSSQDISHPNYDSSLAGAQNANPVGLRYDVLRRFQLEKFILK